MKVRRETPGLLLRPDPLRVASCVGLLLLFGGKPKLLEHTQVIVALPLLYCLVPLEAVYRDAFKLHLLVGWRTKLLSLALVSAAYGVAGYRLVALGYHIIDADADVGEGSKER
jgi:hypothetical protein